MADPDTDPNAGEDLEGDAHDPAAARKYSVPSSPSPRNLDVPRQTPEAEFGPGVAPIKPPMQAPPPAKEGAD